jgi:5-carboxymethyl-2-hydroxymuconate isomerase
VTSSPKVLNEADLKTRIVAVDRYVIGTAPGPRAFVHAQLRLLSGRSPEAKRDLSDGIAAVLRRLGRRPEGVLVQLSVELADMDRGLIRKSGFEGFGCASCFSHRIFQLNQCFG